MDRPRASDRWLTPLVLCCLILVGGGLVALLVACVAYLTVRGYDPQPVLQLAGVLVAAVTSLGTFVVQLVTRKTQTKVERNTGRLAAGTVRALEELELERGRHAAAGWDYEEEDPERGTAPAARGSFEDLDQDAASRSTTGPTRGPSNREERYRDTPPAGLQDTAWFRQ